MDGGGRGLVPLRVVGRGRLTRNRHTPNKRKFVEAVGIGLINAYRDRVVIETD